MWSGINQGRWSNLAARAGTLALALVALAACGGPPAPPAVTPTTEADLAAPSPTGAQPGPLTFMVFGAPDELQAYRDLVTAYQVAAPWQEVELIAIPTRADYDRRLAADFGAGRAADVVVLDYRRLPGFAVRGLLTPVGPYLAHSQTLAADDFFPEAMFPYYLGRDLMCLPQHASGLVVYYNRTLFDQAGVPYPDGTWDWKAFLAAARALTKDTDGDGQTDIYGLGTEVSLAQAVPFIWQNQGELVDNLLLPRLMEIDKPQTVEAVQWFGNWQAVYGVAPGAAAEAAESSEARFMDGRLAMYLNSRRGVGAYRAIPDLDWDAAPLPSQRGRRTNVLFSDGYCLSATAVDKDAAWGLIEFAASAEGQAILAGTGRLFPARADTAEVVVGLDGAQRPRHAAVFLDSVPHLQPMPALENWVEIEVIITDEIQNVFYGRRPATEAMRIAALRAEEYLRFHIVN